MANTLHITSGDIAGERIAKSGVSGRVFVWHDILYEGPREPGWPDGDILEARARFLEEATGGGLDRRRVLETLGAQYALLEASAHERLVLWFDACLFDQSMLCHIMACLRILGRERAELLCVDAFPGIEPYNGLGQLSPEQLASVYDRRVPLTPEQFDLAERVDRAFALQDQAAFRELSGLADPPLPWISAAVRRWLEEKPDPDTGLGKLERLALEAVRSGRETPADIFAFVAAKDTPPLYWGDTTLWRHVNALADREPPLVRIAGPLARLPQWPGVADCGLFRVQP